MTKKSENSAVNDRNGDKFQEYVVNHLKKYLRFPHFSVTSKGCHGADIKVNIIKFLRIGSIDIEVKGMKSLFLNHPKNHGKTMINSFKVEKRSLDKRERYYAFVITDNVLIRNHLILFCHGKDVRKLISKGKGTKWGTVPIGWVKDNFICGMSKTNSNRKLNRETFKSFFKL